MSNFRNVFKFNQTKGGWKEGAVISDMDIGGSTEHGEHADFGDSYRNKSTTGRVRNNSLLKNLSRKMCVCNRSMPSTATMVEYEVSRLSSGVGLHVATSHSASALVEGDFRFDEVQ